MECRMMSDEQKEGCEAFHIHHYKGGYPDGSGLHCCDGCVLHYMWVVCLFSIKGAKMIENMIVGAVAVALIIYLFVALLRPDKF